MLEKECTCKTLARARINQRKPIPARCVVFEVFALPLQHTASDFNRRRVVFARVGYMGYCSYGISGVNHLTVVGNKVVPFKIYNVEGCTSANTLTYVLSRCRNGVTTRKSHSSANMHWPSMSTVYSRGCTMYEHRGKWNGCRLEGIP